jgi:hypothetical protein
VSSVLQGAELLDAKVGDQDPDDLVNESEDDQENEDGSSSSSVPPELRVWRFWDQLPAGVDRNLQKTSRQAGSLGFAPQKELCLQEELNTKRFFGHRFTTLIPVCICIES